MFGPVSLRTRFLLIVLLGAVFPLAVGGLWLTRTAVRQAEEVLATRLREATEEAAAEISTSWIRRRSKLLTLSENPALSDGPESVTSELAAIEAWVLQAIIRNTRGDTVFRYPVPDAEEGYVDPFLVPVIIDLEVPDPLSGRPWRSIKAQIPISALMDEASLISSSPGMVLGAFDPESGASFLPLPFDPAVLEADRFERGGEEWISARTPVAEPRILIVAAAPVNPVVEPFQEAALRGLWILALLTAVVMLLVILSTGRITRSLGTLTEAAEAVSGGDLERSVPGTGEDEIGRLGRAFNSMTTSLRQTLSELSEREALAAIGEFATSMAHDVRNALTSIRLDLQLLEEDVPEGSRGRRFQSRALRKLERLNRTVTGSLELARSGRINEEDVDLRDPVRAAMDSARPEFESREARLNSGSMPPGPVLVRGDASALEQAFSNILLNAAQALDPGGHAEMGLKAEGNLAKVRIRDTGPGIPAEIQARVSEPFFSTRENGTGLGLAIAQRVARAHGGEVHLRSPDDGGTEVEVRLPLL
jgi:signal transduction histidine kinase